MSGSRKWVCARVRLWLYFAPSWNFYPGPAIFHVRNILKRFTNFWFAVLPLPMDVFFLLPFIACGPRTSTSKQRKQLNTARIKWRQRVHACMHTYICMYVCIVQIYEQWDGNCSAWHILYTYRVFLSFWILSASHSERAKMRERDRDDMLSHTHIVSL